MQRPATITEAMVVLAHCIDARSIDRWVSGRSKAPGHKFFATVDLPGRNNINVHGDHYGTVIVEAARQAFDVHKGIMEDVVPTTVSQAPVAPTVQAAPTLTTRAAPAPTSAPAPSFATPPGL